MIEKQETVRCVSCPKCGYVNCTPIAHTVLDDEYREDVFGSQLQEEIWRCHKCKRFFAIHAEYRMINYVVMEDGMPGDTIYDIAE